jgi:hypothetical protein
MVRIDAGEIKSANDLVGFDQPKPGRYHVVARGVDDTFKKAPTSLIVELEILAGTTPDQGGKTFREFIPVDGVGAKRSLKFALACKLITECDLGKVVDISFERAIGCQLVVDLEDDEYEKNGETKKSVSVTFLGFYKVDSPEAAGVPLGERSAKQYLPAGSPTAITAAAPDDDAEWANT